MNDDYASAPIREELRAMLAFLEKMTLAPDDLSASDAAKVRAAGVSEEAMIDAVYVATMFNVINRVGDALNFRVPPPDDFAKSAKMLLRFGYKL